MALRYSRAAMAWFERPSAISPRTSRSVHGGAAGADAGKAPSVVARSSTGTGERSATDCGVVVDDDSRRGHGEMVAPSGGVATGLTLIRNRGQPRCGGWMVSVCCRQRPAQGGRDDDHRNQARRGARSTPVSPGPKIGRTPAPRWARRAAVLTVLTTCGARRWPSGSPSGWTRATGAPTTGSPDGARPTSSASRWCSRHSPCSPWASCGRGARSYRDGFP